MASSVIVVFAFLFMLCKAIRGCVRRRRMGRHWGAVANVVGRGGLEAGGDHDGYRMEDLQCANVSSSSEISLFNAPSTSKPAKKNLHPSPQASDHEIEIGSGCSPEAGYQSQSTKRPRKKTASGKTK